MNIFLESFKGSFYQENIAYKLIFKKKILYRFVFGLKENLFEIKLHKSIDRLVWNQSTYTNQLTVLLHRFCRQTGRPVGEAVDSFINYKCFRKGFEPYIKGLTSIFARLRKNMSKSLFFRAKSLKKYSFLLRIILLHHWASIFNKDLKIHRIQSLSNIFSDSIIVF